MNHMKKVLPLTSYILSLITFMVLTCGSIVSDSAPEGLMTDLLSNPERALITSSKPHFSWIVAGSESLQSAYQIIVASNEEMLKHNKGDIWDSGKVETGQSVSVPYCGEALKENESYWWKVRTWDQNRRVSDYSAPQRFNIGVFSGANRKWPGESRWVEIEIDGKKEYVLENRHHLSYKNIAPVSIVRNSNGNHLINFKRAFFATLRIVLDEPVIHRDTIILHLGEKFSPDNQVDRKPGGSIVYQRREMVLEPGKMEYHLELPRPRLWAPNHQILPAHLTEVTAFRYVEIENWPGDLKINQVFQKALLYHFDNEASYFHSSDNNLNKIWDLCKHTIKAAAFMGVYIDNGTRERMPYEADAHMTQISHYAVDREFAISRYTNDFLIYNPSWPAEWHLHMVPMAWADYMATGDARFLEKRYDELKKKTLIALAREDGLISTRTGLVTPEFLESIHYYGKQFRDIVDWPQGTPANETELRSGHGSATLEGETDRYIFSDINTVSNSMHYYNLVLMEKIAGVLDKKVDKEFFRERSELVKASINEKLFDNEKGLYRDGEGVEHYAFHANMFPVAFGIAPESTYPRIKQFLVSKGMACSPITVRYLFDALYNLGAEDYALELLTSETDRSWMNMIRFGSSGVAEAWDMKYKRNLAWIQPVGAVPTYIISRKIFGIEPLEPSFRKIHIKPHPGNLKWAKLKYPTIRGSVEVDFENNNKAFSMNVTIPPNCQSDIYIPLNFSGYSLYLNGEVVQGEEVENHLLVKDVGPGTHFFKLTK
jgi:alpha-L-rhamnosidase